MPYRKTADDYHRLAKEKGFEWVGEGLPQSTTHPTRWRCKHGHEWKARYCNIYMDSGCPHCYGNARHGPMDYHLMANWHGIYWVGPAVRNVTKPTRWALKDGLIFKDSYKNLEDRKARGARAVDGTWAAKRKEVGWLSKEELERLEGEYKEDEPI